MVMILEQGRTVKSLGVLLIAAVALALLSPAAYAFGFPFNLNSGLSGYPTFEISDFSSPYSSTLIPGPIEPPSPSTASSLAENVTADNSSPGIVLPPDNIGGAKMAIGPMNWTYYQGLPINTASECLWPPAEAMP